MILDSSALIAIIFREAGYRDLLEAVLASSSVGIGAPTLAETALVVSSRLKKDSRPLLSRLIIEGEIETIPFSREHAFCALEAYLHFGKGRHPAALNFGDCMSYAVAKLAALPLLFVGNDFLKTDINSAAHT